MKDLVSCEKTSKAFVLQIRIEKQLLAPDTKLPTFQHEVEYLSHQQFLEQSTCTNCNLTKHEKSVGSVFVFSSLLATVHGISIAHSTVSTGFDVLMTVHKSPLAPAEVNQSTGKSGQNISID